MWQKLDMLYLRNSETWKYDLEAMYRHAVDLSQGGLLEVNIEDFESDSLITYIAYMLSLKLESNVRFDEILHLIYCFSYKQ